VAAALKGLQLGRGRQWIKRAHGRDGGTLPLRIRAHFNLDVADAFVEDVFMMVRRRGMCPPG
jgi:hypothetical protein